MSSPPEQLACRGYVVLRDLLDPGGLAGLRSRLIDAVHRHGWVTGDEGIPSTWAPREGGDRWWAGYASIQAIEELHRLGHDERLTGFMTQTLGTPVLSHNRRVVLLTLPGYGTPPHQDYVSVQGSADTLTAWIPLDDRDCDSGALRLLPVSGDPRLHELEWVDGITAQVAADPQDPAWCQPRVRVGDAVIYHGFTVHELRPNLGRGYQLACEFRFQPRPDPVCRASLMPHHYPRIPGWPELTSGWRSASWTEIPAGLAITGFHLPRYIGQWHRELTIPRSRLLTASAVTVDRELAGRPR
jgi:hypothetical protein